MRPVISLLLAALIAGCATPFPEPETAGDPQAAKTVLDRSIAAHGGYLFDEQGSIHVHYDGRWRQTVKFLQPVLVDAGYRKQSEEVLDRSSGALLQVHDGPDGTKLVARTADDVSVIYNGKESDDETTRAASALVADAYTMFLSGPSFFRLRDARLTLMPSATRDGQTYQRIHAELRPGFGFSEQDEAILWINDLTGYLDLVHFTIDGLASTRGAHVDVAFAGHTEIGGYIWPMRFLERVRGPVRVTAHSWEVLDLALTGEAGLQASN
ncbi:MAG: hypothetical protein GTO71_01480 [Woeseiaceae bacterium]|nr:hypothetical protein [Woeseiaceae bacterium]NIP19791.1 hypothetical protein [Woeseiaceae bacterium]NIS89908.1 hypothetical protein [Woeseiaceae bacterium]